MKHLVGLIGNGEFLINESASSKRFESYFSQRAVKVYGTFSGASVKIGFVGEDGLNHFDEDTYSTNSQVTVDAGKGTRLAVEVSNATSTTDLYIEEKYM